MDVTFLGIEPVLLALAIMVTGLAGFVKGAVGFGLPMIMVSGLGSILSPELALAALILPTVAANLWQALRGGLAAALAAVRDFAVYIGIVLVFIAGSAQLVRVLPTQAMYLILGVPVVIFAAMQLFGLRLHIPPERRRKAEVVLGVIAGSIGGVSGVWGPPTVAYLTSIDSTKTEQIRVQGVVYGAGAIVLLAAHLNSGVLRAETIPLSALMLVPALIGMAVGFRVQDRLDHVRFRKATLLVLVLVGLNLIRRGIVG